MEKNFGYILNYLRTGRLILPPDAEELLREELLEEAEFYQIRGIVEELPPIPVQTCLLKILQSCQLSKSKSSSTNG